MLKSLLVVGLLAAVCFGREIHPKRWHPLSDQMINFINKINTTWKAGRNFDKSISMSYIRGLMGVNPKSKEYRLPEFVHEEIPDDLPESFDAREKWSHCASINLIRDQSTCGSCWAFGAAEAMSDRVCIHSEGKIQVDISAEDLLDCCDSCGDGCNGGFPPAAWEYWKESGLVSGGLYGTPDGCKPYSLAPCEHHTKGSLPNCTGTVPTPKCVHLCRKGYGKDYQADKHFGKKVSAVCNLMPHGGPRFKRGCNSNHEGPFSNKWRKPPGKICHESARVLGGGKKPERRKSRYTHTSHLKS
uniref:Putative cathepsin b-like cysteine protease form 1 n=1 Tax=Ixodes ricinus TaxID=34613 RepID=V5H1J6_IXORI